MESFEDKLKRALEPIDAPDRFTERVMARIERRPAPTAKWRHPLAWLRLAWDWPAGWRPALGGVFACLLLLGIGLAIRHWHRSAPHMLAQQERLRGEQASAQLLLALKITGSELSRMHGVLSENWRDLSGTDKTRTTIRSPQ